MSFVSTISKETDQMACSTYAVSAGGRVDMGIVGDLVFTEAADLADSALANGALKSANRVKRRKRRCSMKIEED